MKREPTIEIYEAAHGSWYWRFKARNGKVIADGSEAYLTAANARRAVNRMLNLLVGEVVIEVHPSPTISTSIPKKDWRRLFGDRPRG